MNNMTGMFQSRLTLSELEFRPHPSHRQRCGEKVMRNPLGSRYLDFSRNSKICQVFKPPDTDTVCSQAHLDLYDHFILVHIHVFYVYSETELGNRKQIVFLCHIDADIDQLLPLSHVFSLDSAAFMNVYCDTVKVTFLECCHCFFGEIVSFSRVQTLSDSSRVHLVSDPGL